ncbi:hypothetical protein [Terriglobus sp.]|uniref:hypothetical protein n=1 Tax=Terriglobus sp. TaxID=1889013 RepID=UPI003B00273F
MRRPLSIVTPLVAAVAASLLTGCRPKEMQRCVDENGTVVADNLCADQQPVQERRPDGHGGFLFLPHIYRPYYGGTGGYNLGDRVVGGSFNAAPGAHYSSPLSSGRGFFGGHRISRGGFGHSFGSGS